MSAKDFQASMDAFTAPILKLLSAEIRCCEIHWIFPREAENNYSFSLPSEDAQRYLEAMICNGLYVSVRFFSTVTGDFSRWLFGKNGMANTRERIGPLLFLSPDTKQSGRASLHFKCEQVLSLSDLTSNDSFWPLPDRKRLAKALLRELVD